MCYYIITAYTDCGHTTEKFSQCLVHLHSSHRPVYCEPSQDVYLDGVLEGNVCLECRRIRNDQRRTERKILAPAKVSAITAQRSVQSLIFPSRHHRGLDLSRKKKTLLHPVYRRRHRAMELLAPAPLELLLRIRQYSRVKDVEPQRLRRMWMMDRAGPLE